MKPRPEFLTPTQRFCTRFSGSFDREIFSNGAKNDHLTVMKEWLLLPRVVPSEWYPSLLPDQLTTMVVRLYRPTHINKADIFAVCDRSGCRIITETACHIS